MFLYLATLIQNPYAIDRLLADGYTRKDFGILTSYWELKRNKTYTANLLKYSGKDIPIFLDSGAFSAHTKGAEITLDEYIDFINRIGIKFELIACLDVITDWRKSWENYIAMKSNGINPLPVYHRGEPITALKQMIETTDYIALGGLATPGLSVRIKYISIKKSFEYIPSDIKVHGFGVSSKKIIKRFPFHSIDSTSWRSSTSYNRIPDTNLQSKEPYKNLKHHFSYKDINYLGAKGYVEWIKKLNAFKKSKGVTQ